MTKESSGGTLQKKAKEPAQKIESKIKKKITKYATPLHSGKANKPKEKRKRRVLFQTSVVDYSKENATRGALYKAGLKKLQEDLNSENLELLHDELVTSTFGYASSSVRAYLFSEFQNLNK